MIKRDPETNLIGQHSLYDGSYFDFGDSSRSTGIMATFGSYLDKLIIIKHHKGDGVLIRHPYQQPWNNPSNFSRDQLIPILSGLSATKDERIIKLVIYACIRRVFLCQNLDLTTPSVILQMILGARLWPLYWFYPIGILWHFLEILFNCYVLPSNEQNQLMCQCKQFGTQSLYKRLRLDWKTAVDLYWNQWRDQKEIGTRIKENF